MKAICCCKGWFFLSAIQYLSEEAEKDWPTNGLNSTLQTPESRDKYRARKSTLPHLWDPGLVKTLTLTAPFGVNALLSPPGLQSLQAIRAISCWWDPDILQCQPRDPLCESRWIHYSGCIVRACWSGPVLSPKITVALLSIPSFAGLRMTVCWDQAVPYPQLFHIIFKQWFWRLPLGRFYLINNFDSRSR